MTRFSELDALPQEEARRALDGAPDLLPELLAYLGNPLARSLRGPNGPSVGVGSRVYDHVRTCFCLALVIRGTAASLLPSLSSLKIEATHRQLRVVLERHGLEVDVFRHGGVAHVGPEPPGACLDALEYFGWLTNNYADVVPRFHDDPSDLERLQIDLEQLPIPLFATIGFNNMYRARETFSAAAFTVSLLEWLLDEELDASFQGPVPIVAQAAVELAKDLRWRTHSFLAEPKKGRPIVEALAARLQEIEWQPN